ncbi:MAG: FAD-dependent oxidoreductase, partial [Clostridiales bacterium]|nr:FAD-dependent oxidoreductase [Clostridiales bacterium]
MVRWIDAIQFERKGGWQEDTQFLLQMGQGYLIAIDRPGEPVEDAVTQTHIPRPGKYRVWARTKNWLREHSPGRFRVSAGGAGGVGGAGRSGCPGSSGGAAPGRLLGGLPTERWSWEIAGDFDLEAGEQELRLMDETGYMARCAALIVTDDFDFTPPCEVERLRRFRAEALGLSCGVADGGAFDVIVAGGGPGGVPAALAAARLGRRTLLIQSRPVLGGNASSEAGVSFNGASSRQPHAREGGIAEEIRRLRDHFGCSWTRAMEMLTDGQPNLTVVLNMFVCGAETENGSIRSVTAIHAGTLERRRFAAGVFIDCTGDGWLGYFAGARYRIGREAGWQHGELLAPEAADGVTMSGCLEGRGVGAFDPIDTGRPAEFDAPAWCYRFPPG